MILANFTALVTFTRFTRDLDGVLATTRARDPVQSARAYDDAASFGRDTRAGRFGPFRVRDLSFCCARYSQLAQSII